MSTDLSDNTGMSGDGKDSNVCRDYMRGFCKRPNCKFLHPNDNEDGTDKKQFCHDFQNKRCHRPNCKYLHYSKEEEEYFNAHGNLPNSGGGAQATSDKPLCKDYIHGKCFREDRCRYFHPPQPQPQMNPQFPGGFNNFQGGGFNDFAVAGNMGPAAKRLRGELYDDDPASLIHRLREENVMLQGNVQVLQRRVQHLEAANEMLLEQNAKLRTGSSSMPGTMGSMVGVAHQWNGAGGVNGPLSKF